MKAAHFRSQKSREQAIALVIVLAFLVLISVMIVAFFSSVQTDLQTASTYSAEVTARQLAETAANVVQGQLSDATKSVEIPGQDAGPANRRLSWASQPGLIRTYDDTGRPHRTFKLYSSRNMIEPTGTDYVPTEQLATEVPSTWPSLPALYTDLNSPVLKLDKSGKIQLAAKGPTYTAQFPIIDPRALQPDPTTGLKIEGFAVGRDVAGNTVSVPGYSRDPANFLPTDNPTAPNAAGETGNPAPMPVAWLYVLQNGAITAPASVDSTGKIARWSTNASARPTKENPIVGRIAFWTDDETCKLNINTASEGVFWDRPWANTTSSTTPVNPFTEHQLAQRIPSLNEFQRFPGHPATTCLSPVLGMLEPYRVPAIPMLTTDADIYDRYYKLTPRLGSGGTRAATIDSGIANPKYAPPTLDFDRLYSSVDELLYQPPPDPNKVQVRRVPNEAITRETIEKAKFFLTAYNRAPEVTLFGTPRLSLWPLQQEKEPNAGRPNGNIGGGSLLCPTTARNAKDVLLAFCSSIGKDPSDPAGKRLLPYFFQRSTIYLRDKVNNRGATGRPKGQNGLPLAFRQLPTDTMQLVPPSSQHPSMDWVLPRNLDLYLYLQALTDNAIPGFGGRFRDKYNAVGNGVSDRDQILTEMVDFIRTGANTYSTGLSPRYEYAPARDMPDAAIGETQLVPLVPVATPKTNAGVGTKGFGRFPTISEAALLFYRVNYLPMDAPIHAQPEQQIRCMLILEPANPTCGPASWSPLVRYVVKGVQNLAINDQTNLFAGNELKTLITGRAGYGSGSNHSTAFNGLQQTFRHWAATGSDANKHILTHDEVVQRTYDEELDYPFVSRGVPIPTGATTFAFSSSNEIEVEVHSGYEASLSQESRVQTLHFRFPAGTWKLPTFDAAKPLLEGPTVPAGTPQGMDARTAGGIGSLVSTGTDILRSVELDPLGPTRGDLRLLAARKDVPANFFAPFPGGSGKPGYNDTSTNMVHSLRLGHTAQWGGTLGAELVAGTPTSNAVAARGLRGATFDGRNLGDWDNGNGTLPDGAYINKPDEGNVRDSEGAYFSDGTFVTESGISFSPNRQVASAVEFGSLSAGVFSNTPWRTLLFCANPAAGRLHPGFAPPRDHLLLDLFTMPIVEPYAISEPFSTAGKVNLNFQIAPFTYITRTTALRGVFKSTRVAAIQNYKQSSGGSLRLAIDATETLKGFEQRFARHVGAGIFKGDDGAFRSASELCDMLLVPAGAKLDDMAGGDASRWWWKKYLYTGDNAREIPYGQIYPRVTTKSNVYTVHLRVQSLRQTPSVVATDAETWREGTDQVLSEYRGSVTLERYIDPADPNLPDFAKNPMATMDEFYKFRVVSTKRFAP